MIRVLNDSRWSSRSFDLLYASSCGLRKLAGRGKEVICVVKGESVWWTSSSSFVDTRPFMAFINISIFSFIICMSYAMHIAPLSSSVGWLVSSCWSCLLAMLLSSRSSLSCWSLVWRRLSFCSSLSHLSCWSLGRCSFLWFNCCSNSWLRWVSRSTVVVRVCTCLSMALEGFSVSWLMVAINRVWTMLLFFLETVIWLITRFPTDGANWWCTKIINKLIVHTHVNRVLEE